MGLKQGQTIRQIDFLSEYIAGENVNANDALAYVEVAQDIESATVLSYVAGTTNKTMGSTQFYQSFVVPAGMEKIKRIVWPVVTYGNSGYMRGKVRSTTTGSDLFNQGFNVPSSGDHSFISENVNLTVTPGATYYLIYGYDGAQTINTPTSFKVNNAITYETVGIVGGAVESGYAWNFQISFFEGALIAKRVYKAYAKFLDQRMNFIGFAASTVTAGNRCKVNTHPIVAESLSGLVQDSEYYLTDTKGAIGTTPGTYSKWIGMANATTILDRRLGTKRIVGQPIAITAGVTFIVPFFCELIIASTSGINGTPYINGVDYGTPSGGGPTRLSALLGPGESVNTQGGSAFLRPLQ